jgi:hypothetical protein
MSWMLSAPGLVERRGFVLPAPNAPAPALAQDQPAPPKTAAGGSGG